MTLNRDIETLISERPICRDTANQYRRSIRCYSEFLRRPALRKDLTEKQVNQWLLSLSRQLPADTLRGRKTGVIVLWNWLARLNKVRPYNSLRLRRIRRPQRPPIAWSIPQVRILLAAAGRVRGTLQTGVKASELLTAWVWIAYETGLRPSDIRQLKQSSISGQLITTTQGKTGRVHVAQISEAALTAIAPLLQCRRDMLFAITKSTARKWESRLFVEAAKLGFIRGPRQGLGTLRKTCATEVCRSADIYAAAMALGHCSGIEVAKRHYVQPDALGLPIAPPFLLGGIDDGPERNSTASSGDNSGRSSSV